MRGLQLFKPGERFSLLCLGAHSDDIEIGAGATILSLLERDIRLDVHWCVLSGGGERRGEAESSAADFLARAATTQIEVLSFHDSFFPEQGEAIKQWFESLKKRIEPDLILTHRRDDAHQDHRQVCQLTWNTFRDHFILEYEIPKYDGDLGLPNFFVHLNPVQCDRKLELLLAHFATQANKHWFTEETFRALMRLRGIESRAPDHYAEAFHCRKIIF